jgi:hypothetical protein
MENNAATNNLSNLFSNPSVLIDAFKNPGKFGLDFYNSLSNKNKQYLAYAAGAGFIIYGITLGRKKY